MLVVVVSLVTKGRLNKPGVSHSRVPTHYTSLSLKLGWDFSIRMSLMLMFSKP